MRSKRGLIAVFCLGAVLSTAAHAANDEKQLETALKEKYQLTKTGIDHLRITQPGTLLVIQKSGIYANPSAEAGSLTTKVTDGNVIGPSGFGAAFFSKPHNRSLKAGTTVYVTRIEVRNKEVRFDLITSDTDEVVVRGSSRETRFAATVAFEFPDGFLAGRSSPFATTIEKDLVNWWPVEMFFDLFPFDAR